MTRHSCRSPGVFFVPNECATVDDVDAIVTEGVATWRSLSGREDVAAVLSSGRVLYEVPFSMSLRRSHDAVILRGVIDCVVLREDGSVAVVEFKTGHPDASHQRQLDLYVDAATALYPGSRVEGLLIYAN